MKKITIKAFLLVTSLSILFSACTKEYFNYDKLRKNQYQKINMQFPAVKTSLVLRDILKDYDHEELFVIDENGFLSLIYKENVYSQYAENIITLSDLSLPEDNLAGNEISGSNKVINRDLNFASFTAAQLDSIWYDTLLISIDVSNTMTTQGSLIIEFPGLKRNGNPVQMNITNYSGTSQLTVTNCHLDLSVNGPNNIQIKYTFNGWNGTSAQNVKITTSIKNQNYKTINGYIGHHDIDLPQDSLYVKIFNEPFEGSFYFKDPKVRFVTNNSFGLPIRLKLDTLYGKDADDVESPHYNVGLDMNPVNYPSVKWQYAQDSTDFDTLNAPWLRDMLQYKPRYVFFDGYGEINPGTAINNNFVIDTSIFELSMKFMLPLWGYASYPTFIDTVEFDAEEEFDKADDVTYLKIRLEANNGFPVQMFVQAVFIDSLGIPQDSLFYSLSEQMLVDGGVTNSEGKVVSKTQKVTEIVYERNRIDKLRHVKNVIFRASIATDDIEKHKNVKFYADDAIDLKLGVHVKGHTDFNFDDYEDDNDTTQTN